MSFKIEKTYTDNPYVDELVYYTKVLGFGTVLKNKQKADDSETVQSLKAGSLYIACVEGTAIFELFTYATRQQLQKAGLPQNLIDICERDISAVPLGTRPALLKILIEDYIANYEEYNDYYRMLYGLPPIGYPDVYVTDWQPDEDIVIDLSIPIHKMNSLSISILDDAGVLDDLFEEDPINRQFIKYLQKKISPYTSRRAMDFGVIYVPEIESDSIAKMYRDKLENNRTYTLTAVYSEAFKYESDYYDNFIAVFIILITMIDIISRVQEFIARKEIFDIRSVKYIFQSYGVPFFANIPLKYQIAMVKNIHTLLKYKSTAKCMVDICSLFGFKNIKIFKYYLLKSRNIDSVTGEYVFADTVNEDGETVEDLEKEFTLKFVKLPLEDDVDSYIRTPSNHIDYDELVDGDTKWDGGLDHNLVKQEILKQEFNHTRTKYISIDTIYDIAKMSMQQTYFFNMLYDNSFLESMINIEIPYIHTGHKFNIADVFTALTVLSYYYRGIKDIIITTQEKVLMVNGFNFKADLALLAQDLENSGYTLHAKECLDGFEIPRTSIPSFGELMRMYVNNLDIREELIKGMQEADNKKVYDVYKHLYDSLMITELTFDFYKINQTGTDSEGKPIYDFYYDEEGDPTFTAFLMHRDLYLYEAIMEAQEFTDEESRLSYIANLIDSIVYALEEYIDTDEFSGLFQGLPVVSSEAVKQYIATVINFYKSYKIDFLGLNTIYYMDDKLENTIRLIDSVELHRWFEKNEIIKLYDFIINKVHLQEREKIGLIERIYLDIRTWVYKKYTENIELRDCIPTIITKLAFTTVVELMEYISSKHVNMTLGTAIDIYNLFQSTKISMTHKDSLGITDHLWVVREGESVSPFMNKPPADTKEGDVLTATDSGDANTSRVNIYDIATEESVDTYTKSVALLKEALSTEPLSEKTTDTASDEVVVSEKKVLEQLEIKIDKE